MDFALPEEVREIFNRFSQAGFQIYLVGGAVRDLLTNRTVKDWDFTTDAKPEQTLKLFPHAFYDNKFGTVGIPSDSVGTIEVTTMRKEGQYQDFRHPDQIAWTDKIEEDLARRDFTINAMALGGRNLNLVDPFGGRRDLEHKIIRAVGEADKRFREDALRLMRAIRFATQLGFEIEPQTFAAISANAQLITQIANERIRDELLLILGSANPYMGLVKLRESGILGLILPELERCFGVVQEGPKHDRIYDIGQHSLLSLSYCPSSDPLVRFATLVHDIGKPDTMQVAADGNVTFYGHDVVGGRLVKKVAERFKLSRRETDKLTRLVRWHLFPVDERQTDSAIRRFIKNVGVENIDDMMALRIGDRLGGGTQRAVSWRMKKFRDRIDQVLQKPFSITDLKVNGRDVMEVLGIPPGKEVGRVLNRLFQEVLQDAEKNNRTYLLNRIKDFKIQS